MHPTLESLLARRPVVIDGALGTELQARGLTSGDLPDAWNLTHPERVAEVAKAYVAAGSAVILTNTFGANRLRMAGHALAAEVAAVNRAGVEIARQAAAGRARVFASLGPSGKMLLSGEVTTEELRAAFEEQAQVLVAAGADGIAIETMSDLEEAKAALAPAKATGLPVVVCLVFDAGRDKDRTMMGLTPEQVARELTEAGADVVGANCGVGIERYLPVCRRLRAATDRPIWIKANAGLPTLSAGVVTYAATPSSFADQVPELIAAGADFIGGCCGTTPAFISAIVERMARPQP
jgi:methionine synthase I (cobalamin-dependent)